ncbi:MAG: hypothetical protein ACHP8A_08335 [Terriglobales bacterium]
MPDVNADRWNWPMWLGFLLALGAVLSNIFFFVHPPGQQVIPWLSLLLAFAALIFVARALWRVFAPPGIHRGRILSSILSLFSLLLAAVAIFAFIQARALPRSASAPQVGQKAPDFTLADTAGRSVSLDQLFAPAADGIPPTAVLLIFYRGYW